MNSATDHPAFFHLSRARRCCAGLAVCVVIAALAGCGKESEKPASQSAARVNKQEITVHQINQVLQQQRGVAPEQIEPARRQALERLIDQELAIQKAAELELDRDPTVMQQIDAARREVISRAYFERIGRGAAKPSDDEVRRYFTTHPELFGERKLYQIHEWVIELPADRATEVKAKVQSAKNRVEIDNQLKAGNLRFTSNDLVRPAEQLPLQMLARFSKAPDGDLIATAVPAGLQVAMLVGARSEPVELERARPAIEAFLLNERKRRIVADDLKALRASGSIRYIGSFADAAPAVASEPGTPPAGPTGSAMGAASDAGVSVK